MTMEQTPHVSIVIPCYNGQEYIGKTLDSVLAQTFTDYETIVVDDGSTDNSAQIIQSYSSVRYRYQPNGGPASARNTGLGMARGDLVVFLDADDLWHPQMLAACVAVLDERPEIGAVHVAWQFVDERGQDVGEPHTAPEFRGDVFEKMLITIPFNGSAVVWRKCLYDAIGGIDETPELNDDWLNWLRIARTGCRFEYVDQLLVSRRRHSGQLTATQAVRIAKWRLNTLRLVRDEMGLENDQVREAFKEPNLMYTVALIREGRLDEALGFLRVAIAYAPGSLGDLPACYALADACGIYASQVETRASAVRAVDHVIAGENKQSRWRRHLWQFCLARRAYEVGACGEARRHLLQSLRWSLKSMATRENFCWVVRILLGRRTVRFFRRLRHF